MYASGYESCSHASVLIKKSAEVEKMKTLKIGVMLLALLLMGMIFVPAVSAATALEGKTIAWNATPEQVVKINELWGKDITVGEYYEQVIPEFLVDMPADLKEKLYTKKWNWSDSSTSPIHTQSSNLMRATPISCSGSLSKVSTVISFSGQATYSGSAPYYMAFATYLKNSADQTVASTAKSGYGVTSLSNSNMWQPDVPSGTFHTYTIAYSITPDYDALPHTSSGLTWP